MKANDLLKQVQSLKSESDDFRYKKLEQQRSKYLELVIEAFLSIQSDTLTDQPSYGRCLSVPEEYFKNQFKIRRIAEKDTDYFKELLVSNGYFVEIQKDQNWLGFLRYLKISLKAPEAKPIKRGWFW
jgi:hypothetical protein